MPERPPEQQIERTTQDLREDLGQLDEHIDEAKRKLEDRREDADQQFESSAGNWEQEDSNAPDGDDPVGAAEPGAGKDEPSG
jgi:hypothetical protein